jgi:hypothetical protein
MCKHYSKKSIYSLKKTKKKGNESNNFDKMKIDFNSLYFVQQRTKSRQKIRKNKYEYAKKLSFTPQLDTINEYKVLRLKKFTPVSQDFITNSNTNDEQFGNLKREDLKSSRNITPREKERYFLRKMTPISPISFDKNKNKARLVVEIIRLFQLLLLVTILALSSYLMAFVSFNVSLFLALIIISLVLIFTLMIFDQDYFNEYVYAIIDMIGFVLVVVLLIKSVDYYSVFERKSPNLEQSLKLNQNQSNSSLVNSNLFGIILFVFKRLDSKSF